MDAAHHHVLEFELDPSIAPTTHGQRRRYRQQVGTEDVHGSVRVIVIGHEHPLTSRTPLWQCEKRDREQYRRAWTMHIGQSPQ
jgi:hypothetical protein